MLYLQSKEYVHSLTFELFHLQFNLIQSINPFSLYVEDIEMTYIWFSVPLTIVFHSRLVGTYGTPNIQLLKINCKLYFDKMWLMSHTNPKVTEVLLFRISFLVCARGRQWCGIIHYY